MPFLAVTATASTRTPMGRWCSLQPDNIPHFSSTQQVLGTALFAIFVVTTVTILVIIRGR